MKAHYVVMLKMLLESFFFRLGRKYLLARNGHYSNTWIL